MAETTSRAFALREHGIEMGTLFKPLNDDHAIERVVFAFAFERPFDAEAIAALKTEHSRWATDLPNISEPATVSLVFDGPSKPIRTEQVPGLEFSYVRPNGSPVWYMRIVGFQAVVECTRYTRWAKVWAQASRMLNHLLDVISLFSEKNRLKSLTLAVTDVFRCQTSEYSASDLLQITDLLPASIFSRGSNWHAHVGWFERLEGGRILHNLNVDSVEGTGPQGIDPSDMTTVRVLHVLELTRDSEKMAGSDVETEMAWVGEAMDHLHSANKNVMANLISPHILDRIGLRVVP